VLYGVALYDCQGPEGWSGGRPCWRIQSPFSLVGVRDLGLSGPGVATGFPCRALVSRATWLIWDLFCQQQQSKVSQSRVVHFCD
jgi:hypothetical protein